MSYPLPLPLVRFSTLERLEELQKGVMYLRNATHYRALETNQGNIVQGDILESKLPYYSGEHIYRILKKENVSPSEVTGHFALMAAKTFICCMYSYDEDNVVEMGKSSIILHNYRSIDQLKTLGEYALVICDTDRFIDCYRKATSSYPRKLCGNVQYEDLVNPHIANKLSEDYVHYMNDITPNKSIINPAFIKNSIYDYQQEFRFLLQQEHTPKDIANEYQGIVETDGVTIQLEDCTSYSFICTTSDLLAKPIVCINEGNKITVGFCGNT